MKKDIRISFNSPAVLTFAIICLGALIANKLTFGWSNEHIFMTYHSSLSEPMTYVRFITHIFGHADMEHLINNMAYILLVGPILEKKYGSRRIVLVVLVTAIVTGLMNYFLFPQVALCGASGVCFAFILWAAVNSAKEREVPITFILVACIFLGQQFYQGLFVRDNISNMAHIVGGLIGSGFGFAFSRR